MSHTRVCSSVRSMRNFGITGTPDLDVYVKMDVVVRQFVQRLAGRVVRVVLRLALAAAASAAPGQDPPVATNLGRVARDPFLVLPLARLEPALDVDLLALDEVLVQA